jgi:hypothetical protein
MMLPEPFEYIDLHHGESMILRITSYEQGEGEIYPTKPSPRQVAAFMREHGLTEPPTPGTPIGVTVPIMRLFGQRLDEQSDAPYWDASSKTLQAALRGYLTRNYGVPVEVKLTAVGAAPYKRYSISRP